MKTIYLDSEFKCYVSENEDMTPVETDFFDGKCDRYIEGYRYVPENSVWTREDGSVFKGLMVSPWKSYSILQAYQTQYESDLSEMEDMQNALNTMGVSVDG